MSSFRQITANQRNALKSTGPTTPEGKQSSRCNALRHGLTAETVIPIEDAEDYQAFEAAVIADYDAETTVERELVLRLASLLWRLRRATAIETALFDTINAEPSKFETRYLEPAQAIENHVSASDQLNIVAAARRSERATRDKLDSSATNGIVDRFLQLTELPTCPLDRLSRYEYLLWRQARQIVITLEFLRRRKGQPTRSRFPFTFHPRTDSSGEED